MWNNNIHLPRPMTKPFAHSDCLMFLLISLLLLLFTHTGTDID